MKYQAQIRHTNGDIITAIWDDDRRRFEKTIVDAEQNLVSYVQSDIKYDDNELFVKIV